MGSEIVYCTVCGDRILARDFERGAATVLKKNYCPGCRPEAGGRQIPADEARPEAAPRISRTKRVPRAEAARGRWPISVPFMVAIGIGLVVIVMLLVVVIRRG